MPNKGHRPEADAENLERGGRRNWGESATQPLSSLPPPPPLKFKHKFQPRETGGSPRIEGYFVPLALVVQRTDMFIQRIHRVRILGIELELACTRGLLVRGNLFTCK